MKGIDKTKKQKIMDFVNKHNSNKKFMQNYIIRLCRSLKEFGLAIKRLKEQHKRDHNLIQIIKKDFPEEHTICLSKYISKFGVSCKLK